MSDYEDTNNDEDYNPDNVTEEIQQEEVEEIPLARKNHSNKDNKNILLGDPTEHKILLVLGEQKCGKTSLIKYLMREYASKLGALIVIGNAVFDNYEKDYSWINKKYCWKDIEDPDELIGHFLTISNDVMTLDPTRQNWMIIDDATGALKKIMTEKKWKEFISLIRKYNANVCIVLHSLQKEASALIKGTATHVIMFPFKEHGTLKIVHDNWVKGSYPFATEEGVDYSTFDKKVMAYGQGNPQGLPEHHFLMWRKDLGQGPRWEKIPKLDLPPSFRIILCKEDKRESNGVYGNDKMWDYSSIENPESTRRKEVGNMEERKKNAARRLLGNKRQPESDVEAPPESEKDESSSETRKRPKTRQTSTQIYGVEESNDIQELIDLANNGGKKPKPVEEDETVEEEDNKCSELKKKNKQLTEQNSKLQDINIRLNCMYQLRFLCQRQELKGPVMTILGPDFFPQNSHHYATLKTEELVKLRDMANQAMVVYDTYSSIESQYSIAAKGAQFLAKALFGFDGDFENSIFGPNIAANAYHALGNIDFASNIGKQYEPDPWTRMMGMVEPALDWLMFAKAQMDNKNLIKSVGDMPVDPDLISQYEALAEEL